MNKKFGILFTTFIIILSYTSLGAVVINKEDAAMYSKKSDYATILNQDVAEQVVTTDNTVTIENIKEEVSKAKTLSEDDADKFNAVKATKNGDKYTNVWADYNITIVDKNARAGEFYDFSDPTTSYDFGVYFGDYSRLAVYYSALSRTIDEIAKIFAPDSSPNDVVIAGNKYRHVKLEVSFPFGTDYFNYYLRDLDGKLMVIETFCENDENGIAASYIDKFMKNS